MLPMGSVPLRSDSKGTELPLLIPLDIDIELELDNDTTRKAIDCATSLPLTVFI